MTFMTSAAGYRLRDHRRNEDTCRTYIWPGGKEISTI